MKEQNLIPNVPNAAKLVHSLRHLDYDNLTAISDIVDNAIDANAHLIWVEIQPPENKDAERDTDVGRIIISDNGCGMSKEILDEAMKLGSDVEKNASCDLGLYGMGLITASISMGTRLVVLTKIHNGECLKSVQDLELIYEKNEFVKTLNIADNDARNFFEKYVIQKQRDSGHMDGKDEKHAVKPSGTVVVIDEIDNCKWKKINGLADNLTAHFGRIYRKFLKADKIHIFVQGKEVAPVDPIYDFEPTILNEEDIKLEYGSIRVTIAELKDYGATVNKEKSINIGNQGFYVLRNNREILAGETLGVFNKHNDFNTLRIEFSYPATLDTILSSNFTKNRIVLNQSVRNKLEAICNPFIRQVRTKAKARQRSEKETEADFTDVEKFITQKSHLLKTPQTEIEKREPDDEKEKEKIRKEIEKHGPRLNITKRRRVTLDSLKVRFDRKKLGDKGPIYDVDQERDRIVVYWNEEHPFFAEFIERNANNPDVFNPICFLVYGLACAELIAKPESDSEEIITSIRYDVGRNLAILLR